MSWVLLQDKGGTVPERSHGVLKSSLGQRLIIAFVAADLLVVGLAGLSLRQSWDHSREEAATTGQNLARLLESGVSASFDQIDLALLAVVDANAQKTPGGPTDRVAFDALLAKEKARAPALMTLRTTDARGLTVFNIPPNARQVSLADRDFFPILRDNPSMGLYISRPYMGRIIPVPVMIFSRRLSAPDGSFDGVTTGSVELKELGRILSQVDVGLQGIVTLRWKDMGLVALKGPKGISFELGSQNVSSELQRLASSGLVVGTYEARSPLDGLERLFSVRRFARYPFYIVVGLSKQEYLAEWRRQLERSAVFLVIFVILTILFATSLHRSWQRHLESERLLLERGERLRETEERFRIAFQTSRDSITINRLEDGAYVAVNEGFARMTGFSEDGVLGRSPESLGMWVDDAGVDHAQVAEGLRRDGFVDNLEVLLRAKDGRTIHGLTSARVMPFGGEQLVLAITRDIGAWKLAEQERDRLKEQVQRAQKLDSIGQLAGGVAHDFNNLLTVILSCCETLRTDLAAGTPASSEDVEQIAAAGVRARDLTRQLLAFARKQVITPGHLDLGSVIRNGERLLRRVLRENVRLAVSVEEDLWPVWCDRGQIEQVLLNLAVNARDALPDGGTLTIEASNQQVETSHAPGDHPGGDWVRMVVRDDGVGMSPEVKAHLFEPFFTTKGPGKGTGLGLATVHGIVTQSSGFLRVESERGAGTRFEIWLPRTRLVAPASPTEPQVSSVGTETILVVEDDAQVREVMVRALEGAGYHALVANDGDEALGLFQASTSAIDLLVTDVVMPGMGGVELAEEFRRRKAGLRVLFVSGYLRDATLPLGPSDGRSQFLAKPFTASMLLQRVRQLLDATVYLARV